MATYYISPTGNDSTGTGTQYSPWLTLQKGYNTLSAGDSLLLMDGTYVIHDTIACLPISGGSLAGGYKTVRAMNKGMAILDGENIGQYCFDMNGQSYIKVKDLVFTRWRWYPIFDNTHAASKWVWFQGNIVHDSGNIMNDLTNFLAGGGVFIGYGPSFWIITQNQFYRVGSRGYDGQRLNKDHAFYSQATSPYTYNIEFSYNLCWDISGNALDFSSWKSIVVNNTIAWSHANDKGSTIGLIDSGQARANIVANNQWYQLSDDTYGAVLERTDYTGSDRWYVLGNMVYGTPTAIANNGSSFWYPGLRHDSWLINPSTGLSWNNWGQVDCNNGLTDPKFVHAVLGDFSNVNFHLQTSSPAINAGYPITLFSILGAQWFVDHPSWVITDMLAAPPTPAVDLDGNIVSGNPDIGCYEYSSGGTTTTTTTAPTTTTTTTPAPTTTTTTTHPTTTTTTTPVPTTTTTTTPAPTTTTTTTKATGWTKGLIKQFNGSKWVIRPIKSYISGVWQSRFMKDFL